MKIVIPLAGMGTRLKPFTLTKAKAMVEVAGKPVLEHIMQIILNSDRINVEEIIFITGYLGNQIKSFVESKDYPFKTTFIEQKELMGQAHAIKLAEDRIDSDCLIWFVDTVSDADLNELSSVDGDGLIYVKEVSNPRRFGQVKEEDGFVTEIKEKADPPISPLVNIGLYYVKDHKLMLESINELIANDMKKKGEFYLMDAFEIMISKGAKFRLSTVTKWYDCGMPDAFLETNRYLLSLEENQHAVAQDGVTIEPPVFIHPSAKISNSKIGPYVSIGKDAIISDSNIENSIILENCVIDKCNMSSSMIGENSCISDKEGNLIVGPFSKIV